MSRYPFERRMSRSEYAENRSAEKLLGVIYALLIVGAWVVSSIPGIIK